MPVTERTRSRPAMGVVTPCLSRHIVVYFPERTVQEKNTGEPDAVKNKIIDIDKNKSEFEKANEQEDGDPLSRRFVRKLIRIYVNNLIAIGTAGNAIAASQASSILGNLEEAMDERSSFGIHLGNFCGFVLRVVIVLYAEHFTLTFILDNEAFTPATTGAEPIPAPFKSHILPSIGDLAKHLEGKLQLFQSGSPPVSLRLNPAAFGSQNEYYCDIIYKQLWLALDLYLSNNDYIDKLGVPTIKGDFRGLSLTASSRIRDERIHSSIQQATSRQQRGKNYWKGDILNYLRVNAPFFSAVLDIGASRHAISRYQEWMRWDTNHILCQVNGEAAVYGSCQFMLNWNIPTRKDRDEMEYDYNRYFLIDDGTNQHKLGRLIRRLHVLGELRAMALVEGKAVRSLNKLLLKLGRDVDFVIDKMTGTTPE